MSLPVLPAIAALARSSPRTYLCSQRFWREHIGLVALLFSGGGLLVVLLGAGIQHGGGMDQGATSILNALFMLLLAAGAVWGGRTALSALAEIGVNRAIALCVDSAAEERLRRASLGEKHGVSELWTLLPDNPSSPVPAMLRLLRQICKEAEGRRFESGVLLVQPFREESFGQLAELERAQRFCLRMGILGTFVGLLLALGALPAALARSTGGLGGATVADPAALIAGLQAEQQAFAQLSSSLLSSLGLAFGTSAVGIAAAVWVAALSESVRRRQATYFKEMEECTLTLLMLASRSLNRDALLSGLEQAGQAMKTLEMQLYDGTRKIQDGLAGVAERVGNQTQSIGEGMQELAAAKSNLDGFLEQLVDGQRDFLTNLRTLYDAASMKRLFEGVEGAVERVGTELEEEVRGEVSEMARRLATLDEAVAGVRSEVGGVVGDVVRRVQNVEGVVVRIDSRISDMAKRKAIEKREPPAGGSAVTAPASRGAGAVVLMTGFTGATAGGIVSEAISAEALGCVLLFVLVCAGVMALIRHAHR